MTGWTLGLVAIFTAGCIDYQAPPPPPELPPLPDPTQPPGPSCGDGVCNGRETLTTCVEDCYVLPEVCGDGLCAPYETCGSCADDCGACPPVCEVPLDLGHVLPLDLATTTVGAAEEVDRASCSDFATAPALHFTWTAPAVGLYQFSVSAGFPVILDVRDGDCNAVQGICSGDRGLRPMHQSETVTIVITGLAGASGPVELQIDAVADTCGDGVCGFSEDCNTCETDCGACSYCGDGTCDAGESCASDCP